MENIRKKPLVLKYNDKEPYFNQLIEALCNVHSSYLQYETYKYKGDKLVPVIKRAERVFAYELYHQYRLLMHNNENYKLNGEIFKDNNIFQSKEVSSCYPDLVLHNNLGFIDDNSQYFLCEIKMSSNRELVNDLYKLTELRTFTKLDFKYYIFLCVGLNLNALRKRILNNRSSDDNRKLSGDIVCICRKKDNIEVFELKEIVPQELLL